MKLLNFLSNNAILCPLILKQANKVRLSLLKGENKGARPGYCLCDLHFLSLWVVCPLNTSFVYCAYDLPFFHLNGPFLPIPRTHNHIHIATSRWRIPIFLKGAPNKKRVPFSTSLKIWRGYWKETGAVGFWRNEIYITRSDIKNMWNFCIYKCIYVKVYVYFKS